MTCAKFTSIEGSDDASTIEALRAALDRLSRIRSPAWLAAPQLWTEARRAGHLEAVITTTPAAPEDAAAFDAFQTRLRAELAPQGVLEDDLVSRIALGLWRAHRSDRIEAALLTSYLERIPGKPDLGTAMIRDASGPRAIDTLLRYRGSAHAELFRALGVLKVLQAEAAALAGGASPAAPAPRDGAASGPAGRA